MTLAPPYARISPLLLPQLSGREAHRANLVAAAAAPVTIATAASPVTVQLMPPTTMPDRSHADWQLTLDLDGQLLLLRCSHVMLSSLLRTFEPALVLDPLPPASILALLIETFLLPLAPGWHRALCRTVHFVALEASAAPERPGLMLEVGVAGHTHIVVLDGDDALDHLLTRWPRQARALPALRVPAFLRYGSTVLPVNILASLRPGDAVLVETSHAEHMPLHLAGGWQAATTTRDSTIMVAEPPGTMPHAETTRPLPDDHGMSIETLPVRLDFDVGHRELSLAELQTLQAGAILSLGRPAAELVEITVHGRRVGTGELVEVDGIPAVRITRLFGLD